MPAGRAGVEKIALLGRDRRKSGARMSKSQPQILPTDRPFWFCLRAQTKREHLAAIGLRKQYQITCFAPRLRMRKLTRRGPSGLLTLCGKSPASFGVPAPLADPTAE